MKTFKILATRRDTYELLITIEAETEADALDLAADTVQWIPDDEWKLADVEEPALVCLGETSGKPL